MGKDKQGSGGCFGLPPPPPPSLLANSQRPLKEGGRMGGKTLNIQQIPNLLPPPPFFPTAEESFLHPEKKEGRERE